VTNTTPDKLPLISRDLDSIIAWRHSHAVSCAEFLGAVQACAARLPDAGFACNACEDQYLFMVGFCAVIMSGQTNLLPVNHRPGTLRKALADFPGSYLLHDGTLDDDLAASLDRKSVDINFVLGDTKPAKLVPHISVDQVAAVVFTSGSTGDSVSLTKTWFSLVEGARINAAVLADTGNAIAAGVSTVPPWHMYGLEWSVMVPLCTDIGVYAGNSFFPADVKTALAATPGPRWLITTPLHLRALQRAELEFPDVSLLMSATSPLQTATAQRAEQQFGGTLLEVYGCSEAGSVATRRPTLNSQWAFISGFTALTNTFPVKLGAVHLTEVVELGDVLEFDRDGGFQITGRSDDLIKIGGKRESLQHLTNQLLSIEGVRDGAFFVKHADAESGSVRLAAFVVGKDRTIDSLRVELADRIDPVFMPRPLRQVDALPREPTGKLPRARLLELLQKSDQAQARE
jgi:acyl-coenzyme A synthetase/AMP-(fatty) acid ligase